MTKVNNALVEELKNAKPKVPTSLYDAIGKLGLKSIVSNGSKKDCMEIALDKCAIGDISRFIAEKVSTSTGNKWATRSISSILCESLAYTLLDSTDDILKNSKNSQIKQYIFEHGLYNNVSSIDFLALKSKGKLQAAAASACSVSALRKLKERDNLPKQVRKTIYQRLGPVECLDEMLDDKHADIRSEGYRRAPYGYARLEEKALTEIARYPTIMLIKKLKKEILPLLLANRNVLKNEWVSRQIQERMETGE